MTATEFRDRQTAGTLYYMAPEILQRKLYGRAVDWWSMGILFYKTIVGRFPFRGKNHDEVRVRSQPEKGQFQISHVLSPVSTLSCW